MTLPASLAAIDAADWQPRLNVLGEIVVGVDDVAQCIRTILLTPKGSVPHHPEFGSDLYRYIDWPLQAARPQIIRETIDAIAANEPRVTIKRVSVAAGDSIDPTLAGSIVLEVEWTVPGNVATQRTPILVGRVS